MKHLVLSRRNLLTLLSKLDRAKAGDFTFCTIIKPGGFVITAVEDDVCYSERDAGPVHPLDDPECSGCG